MRKLLLVISILIGLYSSFLTIRFILFVFGPGFAFLSFGLFPITFTLAPFFFALAYGYWMPLITEIISSFLFYLSSKN